MITLEHALEVAKRLRSLMGSWPLPQEAADTIDALIAANLDLVYQFDSLREDYKTLKSQKPVAAIEISVSESCTTIDNKYFDAVHKWPAGKYELYRAAGAQPYDQQAMEPCDACGWKAIIPGEPCLVCERNEKMLAAGAQPVQAGYQLVRIEPTDQMLEMGSIATDYDYSQERIKRVWQQMLMAAAREQGSPTIRNPRTVESAQDHFAGAGKPIQERIPENCGTGHCSCISCAKTCQWTPTDSDDMPGTWESACGELWSFVEGGPTENNVRFCHGCGKPVGVRP